MDNETSVANKIKGYLKEPRIRLVVIIVVAVALIFSGILVYTNYISPSGQAKQCVNKYLKAIKRGNDTYDYKAYGVDDFVNVLDFKFLNVQGSEIKKDILSLSRSDYDTYLKSDTGETYREYVEKIKNLYLGRGELISQSENNVKLWTGDYYNEFVLLYDVTLTNRGGSVMYMKVYFTVTEDDYSGDYEITDITY